MTGENAYGFAPEKRDFHSKHVQARKHSFGSYKANINNEDTILAARIDFEVTSIHLNKFRVEKNGLTITCIFHCVQWFYVL